MSSSDRFDDGRRLARMRKKIFKVKKDKKCKSDFHSTFWRKKSRSEIFSSSGKFLRSSFQKMMELLKLSKLKLNLNSEFLGL